MFKIVYRGFSPPLDIAEVLFLGSRLGFQNYLCYVVILLFVRKSLVVVGYII